MVTLNIIAEQVLLRISAGFPSMRSRASINEIKIAIIQCANDLLAKKVFEVTYNVDGGNIPDGSVIGTYENNKCVKGSNGATNIPLPVTPLMLPEKMGVFAVYPNGRPDKRFYFVPMDMIYTLKETQLFSDLGDIYYSWDNKKVIVFADLLAMNIPSVDIELCVADVEQAGDDDPLPISADLQLTIVEKVIEMMLPKIKTDRAENLEINE